jgi:tRNA A37 methylthiotransferase MiaB
VINESAMNVYLSLEYYLDEDGVVDLQLLSRTDNTLLGIMEEVGFDAAFMFKYSERPGTYAAKNLPDTIPEEIKQKRLNEIIALQSKLSSESNDKDVGNVFEVLVEGTSKRQPIP